MDIGFENGTITLDLDCKGLDTIVQLNFSVYGEEPKLFTMAALQESLD
jgi:hypothetical protein